MKLAASTKKLARTPASKKASRMPAEKCGCKRGQEALGFDRGRNGDVRAVEVHHELPAHREVLLDGPPDLVLETTAR